MHIVITDRQLKKIFYNYTKGFIMQKIHNNSNSFLKWNNKVRLLILTVILVLSASFYSNAQMLYQDAAGLGTWRNLDTFKKYNTILQDENSDLEDGWTFSTSNGNIPVIIAESEETADDWLMSTGISIEGTRLYTLRFTIHSTISGDGVINLGLYIARESTIEAMSVGLLESFEDITTSSAPAGIEYSVTFQLPVGGNYHFGFYNYSTVPTTGYAETRILKWRLDCTDPINYDSSVYSAPYFNSFEAEDSLTFKHIAIFAPAANLEPYTSWDLYELPDGFSDTDNELAFGIEPVAAGGTRNDWLISPAISIDETQPMKVSFSFAKFNSTATENIRVYLKKATVQNNDITNAILIGEFPDMSNNHWVRHSYYIDSAQYTKAGFPVQGNYYVLFQCYSPAVQSYIFIDSLEISPAIRTTINILEQEEEIPGTPPNPPTYISHGTISQSGPVKTFVGATIPITIIPNRGYRIEYIEINGVKVTDYRKTDRMYQHTVTASAPYSIVVKFNKLPVYTPTYSSLVPSYYRFDFDSLMLGDAKQGVDAIDHFANEYRIIEKTKDRNIWEIDSSDDANGRYLSSTALSTSSVTTTEDWMFTPPFKLENTKNYAFRFSMATRSINPVHNRSVRVYFTRNNNPSDTIGAAILNVTANALTSGEYQRFSVTIPSDMVPDVDPAEDPGTYHFALRSVNPINLAQAIYIDSIEVVELPSIDIVANFTMEEGNVNPQEVKNAISSMKYKFDLLPMPGYWLNSITLNGVPQTDFIRCDKSITIIAPFENAPGSGPLDPPETSAILKVKFEERPTYLPYFYDFTSINDYSNPIHFTEEWTIFNKNGGATWERFQDDAENYAIRMSSVTGTHDDIIVTPPIEPSATNTIKISYKYKADMGGPANVRSVLTREWDPTDAITTGDDIKNRVVVADHNGMNNSSFNEEIFLITPLQADSMASSGSLYLKFQCYGTSEHYPVLDDILVEIVDNVLVTSTTGAGGNVFPSGDTYVCYGGSITYDIEAEIGYMLDVILIDGTPISGIDETTTSYTLEDITEETFVQILFRKVPRYIWANVEYGKGEISPSGTVEVEYGDERQFTITPAYGWEIDRVVVNDAIVSLIDDTYIFEDIVDDAQTILVYFKRQFFNVSVTCGSNGEISPLGHFLAEYEEIVNFTIAPSTNEFEIDVLLVNGFPVDINRASTLYSLAIEENTTIDITFRQIVYAVDVVVIGGEYGSVSPNGLNIVSKGSDLEFTFIPNNTEIYSVMYLRLNGEIIPRSEYADNRYTVTNILNTYTLEVTFSSTVFFVNTSAIGAGTISPVGERIYPKGEDVYITLTPDDDKKELLYLRINDEIVEYHNNVYLISNINADYDITAVFDTKSYIISTTADGGGSLATRVAGNVSPLLPVDEVRSYINESIEFELIPWEGFDVDYVRVNGRIISPNNYTTADSYIYRYRNITANGSIYVYFKQKDPAAVVITSNRTTGGLIYPDGGVAVTKGFSQSFKFAPDPGYVIDRVLVDGIPVIYTKNNTYTFTDVQIPHDIRVEFRLVQYDLKTQVVGNNGKIEPDLSSGRKYNLSSTEVFKFIPDPGYELDVVTLNGNIVGAYNNNGDYMLPIYVDNNYTITATFRAKTGPITYTVTATAGANGNISPTGSIIVNAGDDYTFDFVANDEHHIGDVYLDGNQITDIDCPTCAWLMGGQVKSASYTIENISKNMTINVTFTANVGISENTNNKFYLFPNPTNSIVTIQGDVNEVNRIEILDLAGSQILVLNQISSNQIDVSEIPNGTYTIRIISNDRVETHHIIKVK